MAGGPSAEIKRGSATRDQSHLVQESWGHLLRNFLIVALVAALKPILKDGFQYSDIPQIIGAVIAFTPAFKGIETLPAEVMLEPGEFAMAGAKTIADLVKVIRAA